MKIDIGANTARKRFETDTILSPLSPVKAPLDYD